MPQLPSQPWPPEAVRATFYASTSTTPISTSTTPISEPWRPSRLHAHRDLPSLGELILTSKNHFIMAMCYDYFFLDISQAPSTSACPSSPSNYTYLVYMKTITTLGIRATLLPNSYLTYCSHLCHATNTCNTPSPDGHPPTRHTHTAIHPYTNSLTQVRTVPLEPALLYGNRALHPRMRYAMIVQSFNFCRKQKLV